VRALAVEPGVGGSAGLVDLPGLPTDDPAGYRAYDGQLLVETRAVGMCGTDREIVAGAYGTAPPGYRLLVLGHEAVGQVRVAPPGSGFAPGNWVVPIVRRPDPVPCASCAAGEWDMCRNGRYTEHGIVGADGFARPAFVLDPAFAVRVPDSLGELAVLVEPTSVVAKAWEQIERIGGRSAWAPANVLVTGAGPIGLLAALLARQRGLATRVLDRVTDGPKPELVADLGARYDTGPVAGQGVAPDVVIECTGAGTVVLDAVAATGPSGIVCLTGLSTGSRAVELDAGGWNRRLVLENDVVFGSVNANRRHYEAAVSALTRADPAWLRRLITRRVPLERWRVALDRRPDDVKVVLTFEG